MNNFIDPARKHAHICKPCTIGLAAERKNPALQFNGERGLWSIPLTLGIHNARTVTPAKPVPDPDPGAGVRKSSEKRDSGFRRNDVGNLDNAAPVLSEWHWG